MDKHQKRRAFLKTLTLGSLGAAAPIQILKAEEKLSAERKTDLPFSEEAVVKRKYNGPYKGSHLNRFAFPIGGLGAGMFCLEGTGAISHMSVRNKPEVFNEPAMFAAISVKDLKNGAKVLEGQVPEWKYFGRSGSGNGLAGSTLGLPRFKSAECTTRFPYSTINLQDSELPLHVRITGWSPFIPTDEDNSGLPVGALEYHFANSGTEKLEAVFSYNSKNFLAGGEHAVNAIEKISNGFVLSQQGTKDRPQLQGSFAIFTDDDHAVIDHCWFRGGWWDPLTMAWNNIREARVQAVDPVEKDAGGASLYIPFSLLPGTSKTIRLMMSWYFPETDLHIGTIVTDEKKNCDPESGCCAGPSDLGVVNGK
ncbi:MAG TPA: GH116 family glycosyl-hydrolase, partial [Puia sp.]